MCVCVWGVGGGLQRGKGVCFYETSKLLFAISRIVAVEQWSQRARINIGRPAGANSRITRRIPAGIRLCCPQCKGVKPLRHSYLQGYLSPWEKVFVLPFLLLRSPAWRMCKCAWFTLSTLSLYFVHAVATGIYRMMGNFTKLHKFRTWRLFIPVQQSDGKMEKWSRVARKRDTYTRCKAVTNGLGVWDKY